MAPVLVLDYGIARARRILRALQAASIDARLADTPLQARTADWLLVPDGDDADTALSRGVAPGVLDAIAGHAAAGRPLLCIGLALTFLLEGRTHPAMPPSLGILKAPVQRFDPRMTDDGERPLLVPHAGSSLIVGLDRHPALRVLVPRSAQGTWMTFRHRLCAPARVPQADVAVCHHGVPFAGAIWRGPILAVHFLPEQSGRRGIEFLQAWRQQ